MHPFYLFIHHFIIISTTTEIHFVAVLPLVARAREPKKSNEQITILRIIEIISFSSHHRCMYVHITFLFHRPFVLWFRDQSVSRTFF